LQELTIESLISRQEHIVDITAGDRIASFQRKLEFWDRCVKKKGNVTAFLK